MKRNFLRWMMAFGLLGLAGCGRHEAREAAAPAKAMPVATVAAAAEKVASFEQVVGTVRPKLEATVAAKISGRIVELAVVPGQKVEAGQRVATLEAGELEASRNRAAAALEQADRELASQHQLLAGNATSRAMFDQAEAAQRMAAAGLAEITTTLREAVVTAPFAGTVARKMMDTGDLAVPGKGIVQLEDPTSLRLETAVPESLAGKLVLGQRIPVTVEAAGKELVTTVGELSPSADAASRTFLVKLDFPPDSGLRPGLFGRAHFPRGERTALLVPASSVRRQGQMETVFAVENNKAVLRLVRTVPAPDGRREVLTGLIAGSVVVLDPPVAMTDGAPVEVQ